MQGFSISQNFFGHGYAKPVSGTLGLETDPVYSSSTWFSTTNNSANWNTAYSWGNHSTAGYLTSYSETDPIYSSSSWFTTINNSTDWDTAFSWGDHASVGYVTGTPWTSMGYLTAITGGMVTTALGFTPYNSTNPSGYQTASDVNTTLTSYVPNTRTITINGVAQDLSANRSWTVSGVGGGITNSVTVVSGSVAAADIADTIYYYIFNGVGNLTLPTAVGNTNLYVVKNSYTENITIDFTGGENADGSTLITLTPLTSLTFISDNTNYVII